MDWEKNRLAIGAVVLVGVIGVAVWASQKQEESRGGDEADSADVEDVPDLLPDLDKDEIDELVIERADTPTVRLTKVGDGEWRVSEPVDAPADMTTVNTALDKLDEMTMVRVAATNSANHERLQVTEETAIRVIVRSGGNELANLLFGTYGNRATMIRPEGEERVAAAEGSLKFAFNKDVKDWRNRRVVDVAPADIVAINFVNGENSWRFDRSEGDEWAQPEGAAEIERFGASRVQSTVSSLARMRATDFAPEEIDAAGAGVGDEAKVVTLWVRQSSEDGDEGEEAAEGEGEAEGEEQPEADAPTEQIVLRLGNQHTDDSDTFYLQREGDPVIYLVSSYLAERMEATLSDFQTPEAGEEGEAAAPPPGMPGMPGMPGGPHGGMPPGGPGGPGGGQIPPEVMQQIQQQIQAQQAAGGGGGGGGN